MDKDLNAQVTRAIINAESSLETCIKAWDQVLEAEEELAKNGYDELDRAIGSRGAGAASVIVKILKLLRGGRFVLKEES